MMSSSTVDLPLPYRCVVTNKCTLMQKKSIAVLARELPIIKEITIICIRIWRSLELVI